MQTMTDYQKQGIDFLMKNKIKMSVKYVEHKRYFEDDKTPRDIFRIRIWRTRKSFSFRFGQSFKDSTGFGTIKPSAYDVLACLTKNEPGTFKNFCSDFGYEEDSRKAERTYKAVCKEWKKVSAFFTENELEQLQEIH